MENLKNNPLLSSITLLYEKREKLFRNPDALKELSENLKCIENFFSLDTKTSAVMGVLICEQIMGTVHSLEKSMQLLGFDPFDFIAVNEKIQEFRKKGWVKLTREKYPEVMERCEISNEIILAIMQNDRSKLTISVPGNLTDTLLLIRNIIREITNYQADEKTVHVVMSSIERFHQYPFIGKILNNESLEDIEKAALVWLSTELLFGVHEFNLNDVLQLFNLDSADVYYALQRIRDGKSIMMKDGFIRFVNPNLADFNTMSLGEEFAQEVDDSCARFVPDNFVTKYCQKMEPDEIQEQFLFFNPSNKIAIDSIFEFTSPEKYEDLEYEFELAGFKPGLTMLFYGPPGTGKTELVKQIAKMHGRIVLQVDIASIKNMWVGESEKNLKGVFKEYAKAIKFYQNTPILLFNEADALLGERHSVQNAVDQMLNSMQNILLQELEDFKGIFIATTNLIKNIDRAFDRRMLYKLKFENPDEETRYRILRHQFPELSPKLLKNISRDHVLSGGQIQNIKKKYLVDNILGIGSTKGEKKILNHIQEETQFRSEGVGRVGFGVTG